MPWHAVRTWVAGDLAKASYLNGQARDNVGMLNGQGIARTRGSTVQAYTIGPASPLPMNIILLGREGLATDLVVNDPSNYMTINRSGVWHLTAHLGVNGSSVGVDHTDFDIAIRVQPPGNVESIRSAARVTWPVLNPTGPEVVTNAEFLQPITAGSTVSFEGYVNSGVQTGFAFSNTPQYSMVMTARWVRPLDNNFG